MGRANERKNAGFKSKKQQERHRNVAEAMQNHWRVNSDNIFVSHDHSYFNIYQSTPAATRPNLADVILEEVIDDSDGHVRSNVNWGEGRRVVELDVLSNGLKACTECGNPLHLHHSTGITTYGLGAILNGL
jgi:hypothetical protein